ncbi:DUF5789 family protein [Halosimplex salinum]|uniref:DUF5789 family protein n=1 Tax=Halosimplex salinum TaxID=1710538 RepID=UPI000F490E57|nr:hypothetical protein [Halosimplex salinum]
MTDDGGHDRFEGVDFTEMNPVLEELSYPVSTDEFVADHGDRELPRTNADPISVGELFSYMGDATFESEGELRQTLLGQMPRGTGGRTNYSDRGGSTPVTTEAAKRVGEQTAADLERGDATDPDATQQ